MSHSRAAARGSSFSEPETFAFSPISSSVLSFAETALMVFSTSAVSYLVLITGTTFWLGKLFFGSSRTTKLFSGMAVLVVKMLAACT